MAAGTHEENHQTQPFDEPLAVSAVIAAGMGAGLMVPGLADGLRSMLLPSLFVIVLASLLPFRSVAPSTLLSMKGSVLLVVLWLQGALPLLVLTGSVAMNVPEGILPYIMLSACSGAVFASPALASLFGLDRDHAARIMILSTLLMPVSLCVFVGPLVGLDNAHAFSTFGFRVLVFLVAPALIVVSVRAVEAALARNSTVECDEDCVSRLDVYATRVGMLGLSVFAASIMAGVAESAASDPGYTASLFAGALLVNLGMMVVTRLALAPLGADVAHTASIVAMTRNVGLAYAMTHVFFGETLAQYVALCQVPLLVGPMIVRLRTSTPRTAVAGH